MIEKEDVINLVVALSKEDEWVRKQIAILLLKHHFEPRRRRRNGRIYHGIGR